MKRLAIAAAFVTAAVSRRACAEPPIEDIHLEYRAPDGCPAEPWVLGRVRARTDRFRVVPPEGPGRTFSIVIQRTDAGYSGDMTITEPGPEARPSARHMESPRCEELADGLSLIVALAIDPEAHVEVPTDEAPPSEREPERPAPPAAPAPRPPPHRPERRRESALAYFRLGAGLVGLEGAAPRLLYGGEGFLEAGRVAPKSWFAPAGRAAFRHARHDGIAFPEGTASFRLTTIPVDVCVLRVPIPNPALRLCATGDFGWLDAEGTQAENPRHSRRGWVAAGAVLRAALSTGRIGVEATVGAEAPFRRDRFLFDSKVGEVDAVVVLAGLALTGRVD